AGLLAHPVVEGVEVDPAQHDPRGAQREEQPPDLLLGRVEVEDDGVAFVQRECADLEARHPFSLPEGRPGRRRCAPSPASARPWGGRTRAAGIPAPRSPRRAPRPPSPPPAAAGPAPAWWSPGPTGTGSRSGTRRTRPRAS